MPHKALALPINYTWHKVQNQKGSEKNSTEQMKLNSTFSTAPLKAASKAEHVTKAASLTADQQNRQKSRFRQIFTSTYLMVLPSATWRQFSI